MEITVPKLAMIVAALALAGGLGAWGWASSQMEGRLATVRNEARAIGYARGGRLPTNAEVETQVRAIAEAQRVELTSLAVTSHDQQGIGGIGHLAPQLGQMLTGTTRVYEIRAIGATRELAWSLDEPLEVDLTLRREVSVRASGGGGSVRPSPAATGVSTDVHGGLSGDDLAAPRRGTE